MHVHPEGDKYYRLPRLRAVTPVSPLNPTTARILEQAATALLQALGSAQGDNTIEIYLNIPGDGKNAARATSTVDLGLDPFETDGFLKSALTGEYWNHVENFLCHQIYWADAVNELKGILGHGAIDDLTSPGSTCPWSAKECAEYTSILGRFKTCDHNEHVPYRVVSIARLWAMIARVRHINQYGLTSPRLDRLQGLILHQAHSRDRLATAPDIPVFEFIRPRSLLNCHGRLIELSKDPRVVRKVTSSPPIPYAVPAKRQISALQGYNLPIMRQGNS
ncbi:hypothetical protein FRC05_005881 [Tulasnella sp. 425]|nr:hypothetical protein FRC05_005881 [Tulasnella sp. 425]